MGIKQLIGKRVQNIKTKRIGIITAVQGNMLFVNTAGETIKYLYPDAFATTLILEDEWLQEEMEHEAADAAFDSFRKLYKNSIFTEISYLKETGGKRYKAVDGELIDTINGEHIYSFDTDVELHFPDNTQIKIWQIDTFITAYVISCEEFSIIFRTKEFLGKEVDYSAIKPSASVKIVLLFMMLVIKLLIIVICKIAAKLHNISLSIFTFCPLIAI